MFDEPSLQTGSISRRRSFPRKIAPALLMLALWLGLVGLASSERLHRLLHPDSHQLDHECLVTGFAKSHLLGVTISAHPVSACAVWLGLAETVGSLHVASADVRLSLSRAPPVGSLLP